MVIRLLRFYNSHNIVNFAKQKPMRQIFLDGRVLRHLNRRSSVRGRNEQTAHLVIASLAEVLVLL